MKVKDLIELLLTADQEKEVVVQTVDGRFEITGYSEGHQGLEFKRVCIDTQIIERFTHWLSDHKG